MLFKTFSSFKLYVFFFFFFFFYFFLNIIHYFYFRLQLFSDESSFDQWEDDLAAVLTPCSKKDNSFDSGFKSQSDVKVGGYIWVPLAFMG